jgi:hypothetical protein
MSANQSRKQGMGCETFVSRSRSGVGNADGWRGKLKVKMAKGAGQDQKDPNWNFLCGRFQIYFSHESPDLQDLSVARMGNGFPG